MYIIIYLNDVERYEIFYNNIVVDTTKVALLYFDTMPKY